MGLFDHRSPLRFGQKEEMQFRCGRGHWKQHRKLLHFAEQRQGQCAEVKHQDQSGRPGILPRLLRYFPVRFRKEQMHIGWGDAKFASDLAISRE